MKKPLFSNMPANVFFLPLFILGVFLILPKETNASPQGGFLTAVQITDHALTGEDAKYNSFYLTADIGHNSAFVVWREQNINNTGTDLFYRRLPNGSTQRLSNIEANNNAGVYFQTLRISDSDTPHILWEEYPSGVDSRDIYYWNPNDGLVQLVNQTPTIGFATFRPVIWLDGDDYHIVWEQQNATQTDDIFMYWNSITKIALEIPGFENGVVKNGILHVTWVADVIGPVQYWNSDNQNIVSLPNSTSSGSDTAVYQKGIFVDKTNEIKIFFGASSIGDPGDPATNCLASWSSVTQNTTMHVTGNRCYSMKDIQIDSNGVFHTFGVDSTIGPASRLPFYWNSSLANPIYFDVSGAGTGFFVGAGNLHLAENGKAHIVWEDDNDLYYWNPEDQQIVNLSASLGANTMISSYLKYRSFDSTGNLHVFWREQTSSGSATEPFYWDSAEQITTNLLTKLGFDSIEYQGLTSTVLPAPMMKIYGVATVGGAGAYYWNIAEDTITPVWHGPDLGGLGTYFSYTDKPDNGVLTSWIDPADYSFVVNSSEKGNQMMNQTAADDTDNLVYITGYDDFGNIYTIWTEMSDSSGEGLDFFAAWSSDFAEGNFKVYLPLTTR